MAVAPSGGPAGPVGKTQSTNRPAAPAHDDVAQPARRRHGDGESVTEAEGISIAPATEQAAAACRPSFPGVALLERLGPEPVAHGWARFLPKRVCADQALGDIALPRLSLGGPGAGAASRAVPGVKAAPERSGPLSSSTPGIVAEDAIYENIRGRVWFLSQDAAGCRQVQHVLDLAGDDAIRKRISRELEGHVAKGMKDPHANHVLQKCIAVSRPEDIQFIVDEILERPDLLQQATRHRYACRIVQHLLRFCPEQQLRELTEGLLADAAALSCHTFGSYVLQQLAEHCSPDQRRRLVRSLGQDVATVAANSAGCSVLVAAMRFCSDEDATWLARSALSSGVLPGLAETRSGPALAQMLLRAVPEEEQESALASLSRATDDTNLRTFAQQLHDELRASDQDRPLERDSSGEFQQHGAANGRDACTPSPTTSEVGDVV